MKLGLERVSFGAQVADAKVGEEGTPVERVTADSPAGAAGIRAGDIILKVDELTLRRAAQLADALAERRPGDLLKLTVVRSGKELPIEVKLAAERPGGGFSGRPGGGGFGNRSSSGPAPTEPWTKPVYRLAVIGVEFDDVKHNAKIPVKEWEAALFSKGVYSKKNATGQDIFGSLNDFFLEQSCGAFHVEGKVFDWVTVSKKRPEYSQGSGTSNRSALPAEAVEKLLARDGKESLKNFDGVFIIYAGASAGNNRGAVYFPHAGTITSQGRRLPYMLSYEGGERMATLRTFCREFCYLLGLPELAARTENIGSEGVGAWCLMGGPLDGKPQGLCSWSKEQLGWLKPAVIDPTVQQKLILAPVSRGAAECVKVLVRSDGSEYFLLENRTKAGYDSGLPGEGLLIWRVLNNRPLLEESHGIEGAVGARSLPEMIPFPSKANHSFTPVTTPSSKSARGGGLPVHITEIRRLPDGRITFHVGYEFQ
jgi:M6 family metalloprotease-like protein